MTYTPIEGWILRTIYNGVPVYWKVSGYRHYDRYKIAIPYRYGSMRIPPEQYDRLPLPDPIYLNCIGRRAYLIDVKRATIYNPEAVLKQRIRDLGSRGELINLLMESGVAEWIGLTGSWAIYMETMESDVDLLIYTRSPDKLYKILYEEALNGGITQCKGRYNTRLPYIHGFRLLDACYKGVKYTLRLLLRLEDEGCCYRTIYKVGSVRGSIEILYPISPYTVPATYAVYIKGLGRVTLETWHSRYQELSPGPYKASLDVFYDKSRGIIVSPDLGGSIEAPPRSPRDN